jgi:signal transduction histidine kinase
VSAVRVRPDRLFDLLLAAVVVATGLAEVWVPFESRQGEGSVAATTVVVVVIGSALAWRRTQPLAAGVLTLFAWAVVFTVTPTYVLFFGQFVPMAVAVFSMARHGQGRVPWYGAAAGALALLYFDLFVDVLQNPSEIVFHWGVFAIVWGFGFGLRRLERRAEESTRRAVEAEVAAAERAMLAVVEERARIARELHDIVAHAVSMMVVQAGAAEQVVHDDPELVRRALATIRATGGGALEEMRRMVMMLRADGEGSVDEPGPRGPQPGMAGLPGLVADARATGIAADLEVRGEPLALPAGLDLAAYRIVQEALTNTRRHAAATTARVLVEYDGPRLTLEVTDDGTGGDAPAEPGAGGHGLVGMRERVALYKGRVEAGPAPGGGFRVRAELPLPGRGASLPGAGSPTLPAAAGERR